MTGDISIGVDVGTQGVRALAVDLDGIRLARHGVRWPLVRGGDGRHEQVPQHWFEAVIESVRSVVSAIDASRVAGIAITGTSGTLVLVDSGGEALRRAIMWDDTRAQREAEELRGETVQLEEHSGLRLRPSYPLAKLAWLERHDSQIARTARWYLHQSDWLLWRLSGCRGTPVTDPTNALKSGFDPVTHSWIDLLATRGWLQKLPDVVTAGSVAHTLDTDIAALLGLPNGVPLVAAMTDANTATLGAGLHSVGTWSSTLGTGLSIKGRASRPLAAANAGIYSHAHPFGGWLTSGTMQTGGGVVTQRFGSDPVALRLLNAEARTIEPGESLSYPLVGRGEFFPFWAPEATGFAVGQARGQAGEFRAVLEGIAVIEHMAFARLEAMSGQRVEIVNALGGATSSSLWNSIRASVLGRALRVRRDADTALGACITVAVASGLDPAEAMKNMTPVGTLVEPDPSLTGRYADVIDAYRREFEARGYLNPAIGSEGSDKNG